ncbi:hypothetical protein CCHL11_00328 [Colletotrichum chlorophyti]|uniref:Uncharacterized protein n=1 Tax=Colletotrichum chlorophyti TaxID=708187 RepID=A0A1Q8RUR1_9PEZI|nr:hypothetical protein CCHL11_00328 [Colletotrichum chlorophyti]
MQLSNIVALLASVATVHAATAAAPEVRQVASLLKRQGLSPAQCASQGLSHCKNGAEACPAGCFCS